MAEKFQTVGKTLGTFVGKFKTFGKNVEIFTIKVELLAKFRTLHKKVELL